MTGPPDKARAGPGEPTRSAASLIPASSTDGVILPRAGDGNVGLVRFAIAYASRGRDAHRLEDSRAYRIWLQLTLDELIGDADRDWLPGESREQRQQRLDYRNGRRSA